MHTFEGFCLSRRVEGILSVMPQRCHFATQMLIEGGLTCSSKQCCANWRACSEAHADLKAKTETSH